MQESQGEGGGGQLKIIRDFGYTCCGAACRERRSAPFEGYLQPLS